MGIIDNGVSLIIVGGIGYLAYDYYKNGACGGILKGTPACAVAGIGKGAIDFFSNQYDTGDAGVPFELERCDAGYTDFGLTCTRCMSIGDCVSGKGCGCNTVGKLDHQKCPSSHPDKIGLLCYKRCPEGWIHTEGMPYLCRDGSGGNFWDKTVGSNWKGLIPFGSYL